MKKIKNGIKSLLKNKKECPLCEEKVDMLFSHGYYLLPTCAKCLSELLIDSSWGIKIMREKKSDKLKLK